MADEAPATPPQEQSILEKAEAANKALEENIKKQEAILKKMDEISARNLLSGRSSAGSSMAKPDLDAEETKRINDWLKPFGRKI